MIKALLAVMTVCLVLITFQCYSEQAYNLVYTDRDGDDYVIDHGLTFADCLERQIADPSSHFVCHPA